MGSKGSTLGHFKDRQALPSGHEGKLVDLRFSPEEDFMVSVDHATACVWSVPKEGTPWKAPYKIALPGPYAQSVDVMRNKVAVARTDSIISIYGTDMPSPLFHLKRHTESVSCCRFNWHRSELLLSGSLDGTTILWDIVKRTPTNTFTAEGSGCTKVAWSNGSIGERTFLASFTDATVKLFDVREKKRALVFAGHDSDVNSVAWAKDDSFFASASSDSTVCIWDPKKPDAPVEVLRAPQIKGGAQDVSIGGRQQGMSREVDECFAYVAYEQPPYFVAWPIPSSGRKGTFMSPALSKRVTAVQVSPTGRYFATGDWGHQVIVWDVEEVKKSDWHTAGRLHI